MSQQIVIDSLSFAREGKALQGELPVSGLERLHDALAEIAGSVVFRLAGRMSRQDKPQLVLEVTGQVPVICQRCLGRLDYPLSIDSVLELIADEVDLSQDELEDDTRDFLVAQKELDVVALVEDEIILALPSAPRHDDCALPDSNTRGTKVSPFAALAALKKAT
ncbi:MAG: DUF177 domain-containing protein [Rhodocyclaceae bacterium]|jgi:uncharacterized protein|nr:MAG: DUF177 domain-containing protein [Rhodocyclaceae bacterium]